jgi:hypothetical protein
VKPINVIQSIHGVQSVKVRHHRVKAKDTDIPGGYSYIRLTIETEDGLYDLTLHTDRLDLSLEGDR